MIGFLIKKAFFDLWDNMLRIVLVNLGFNVILSLGIFIPYLTRAYPVVSFLVFIFFVCVFNYYTGAASFFARDLADYKSPGFADFTDYLKQVWKSSIVLSVITVAQIVLYLVGFPFYIRLGGFLGLIAIAVIFWISVAWTLASQFYYPIRSRMEGKNSSVIKKSFVLLLDNTMFSIFLGIAALFTFIISFFTALLLPGITGILLWHQAGLKLRLYKYDYLEEHPDVSRRKIPWGHLLKEEQEKVGTRTLKGMLFPWKE
jgi:hypothetical protein